MLPRKQFLELPSDPPAVPGHGQSEFEKHEEHGTNESWCSCVQLLYFCPLLTLLYTGSKRFETYL